MPEVAKKKTMDEALMDTLQNAEQQENAEAQPEDSVAAEAAPSTGAEAEPKTTETVVEEGQDAAEAQTKDDDKPPAKEAKPATDGKAAPAPKPNKATIPRGWPVAMAGEWHNLPRQVKNEFLRREGELARERVNHSKVAKEHAEAAKVLNGFNAALEPYMPNLKAMGVAPDVAVKSLLQTEHVLRTGTQTVKSQVIATLMRDYGVSVGSLAAVLEGKPPEADPRPQPKPEEFRDARLDALMANARRAKQQRETASKAADDEAVRRHKAELIAFRDSGEAEFLEKVLPQMKAVNMAAAEAGEDISLQEMYERACYLNKEVRTVLEQRKAEEAKHAQTSRTRQAIAAASSVKTEPGAPRGAVKKSLDDAMYEVIQRHG